MVFKEPCGGSIRLGGGGGGGGEGSQELILSGFMSTAIIRGKSPKHV